MLKGAIARRYAGAIFDIALKQNTLDRTLADVQNIASLFSIRKLVYLLREPNIPVRRKETAIRQALASRVLPTSLNLALLVIQRELVDIMPNIARELNQFVLDYKHEAIAEVTTATTMASWADEISGIIEKNIAGFGASETAEASVGTVIAVQDGIARVYGLQDVKYLELVEFPRTGIMGMAFNLEEETVSCPILGDFAQIREDDEVRTTGRIIQVPVGDALIGRVVNPLGEPLDDKGPIVTDKYRPGERVAPGVITRQPVNTPGQTGIKAIDSMIPIGRGQRELIIGDRQTGKTAIAIDTIINQKGKDLLCIYVAIGQKNSSVARTQAILEEHGAMEHTIIVVAGAADPAPLKYIAPYSSCSMVYGFI